MRNRPLAALLLAGALVLGACSSDSGSGSDASKPSDDATTTTAADPTAATPGGEGHECDQGATIDDLEVAEVAGSENDRTTCHRIPLTALIEGTPVPIVANVYGLRRQPYITEIYANTSAGIDGAAPPAPPASIRPNPKGYVAIKLFNPTDVAISLRYCRLVGLHRSRQTPWAITPGSYQGMSVQPLAPLTAANAKATDQIELGNAGVTSNVLGAIFPPYVIPPHGTLVLENLPGSGVPTPATAGEDATYRPTSTGLLSSSNDNTGLITPTF